MGEDRMRAIAAAAARAAGGLPGALEGIACAGTAVESRTYAVKGKAFVFVRPGSVMLKLGASSAAAERMATGSRGELKVGAGGWVTISGGGAGVTGAMVGKWVKESYGLFAGAGEGKKKK